MRRALLRCLVAFALGGATLLTTPASAPADPGTPPTTVAGPAPGPASESGSIVVRAAGDRDPTTGAPLPLAGAVLRAFTDASLTIAAGECTTDAAGTCTITGLAVGTYRVAEPDADALVGLVRDVATRDARLVAQHEPGVRLPRAHPRQRRPAVELEQS